jgi:hypothetical protein
MNTIGQFCSVGFLFICSLSMLSAVRDMNALLVEASGVLALISCIFLLFFMLREKLKNQRE